MGFISNFKVWKESVASLIKATFDEAYPKYPFKVYGPEFDEDTCQWIFFIKAKNISNTPKLTAEEIIKNDYHFESISPTDRKKVKSQYLIDIAIPKARIENIPLSSENDDIFKIFMRKENKIVVGNATYFITEREDIIEMLCKKDIIRIALNYFQENPDKFSKLDDKSENFQQLNSVQNNIVYLKNEFKFKT